MAANTGWVNVGTDGDTAAFAVESIRRWWQAVCSPAYPVATRLLITAVPGYPTLPHPGLEGRLAALAAETGLDITVCHFPPGTSKWNRIEHRLFSHISMNWRGRPLTSHEVIVETIAATTTRTGLTVRAQLDTGSYPAGIKISDQQMAALPITRHDFHGDWNYCLHPRPGDTAGQAATHHTQAIPGGTAPPWPTPRSPGCPARPWTTWPPDWPRHGARSGTGPVRTAVRSTAPGTRSRQPPPADPRRPRPGDPPPPAPVNLLPAAGPAARRQPHHDQPGDLFVARRVFP